MRSNYKAKWQAALQEQRPSTSIAAKEHVQNIDENRRINTDLNLAVQQIASINGQVTAAAADVLKILDETRNLAGLNFGEVQMEIDSKASKLPIHISLRRTRDILKMITARYAALAVIVEDQEEAIRTYAEKVKTIPSASHLGTRTLLDNVWIGPYSTEVEREDYKESRDEYKRYNLTYEDLDDDWLTTHITGGSALRERKPSTPSLVNGDGSDSELDEAQQRTMTVVKNRRAVVTPISPVQKKLKSHDDLA